MLHTRYISRLFSRKLNYRRNYATALNKEDEPPPTTKDENKNARYHALLQQYDDKITFNSHLEATRLRLGHMRLYVADLTKRSRDRADEYERKKLPPLPISLKYVVDKDRLLKTEDDEEIPEEPSNPVVELPYSKAFKVQYKVDKEQPQLPQRQQFDRTNIDRWMTNYDYFDDTILDDHRDEDDSDDEIDLEWSKHYGTPDPNERVSRIQCGGCGAFLHCTDTSIPGYIPSEIFKHRTQEELRTIECQRCHFLKQFNIALNVNVHPDEYEKLLSNIREQKALVIVMIDLLDFPCSIWPGIVDIIGTKRPVVIVGNKVDLIPGDAKGYLKRIRESLIDEIKKTRLGEANIRGVSLISAKTGYGVEELITLLFKTWLYKGDVYLLGCTNVGKSSLFNALLQSDYCKVHAVDIIKRATVSRWPGTTLNLLKFPINRPSGWKIYTRSKRLKADAALLKAEKELQESNASGKSHRMPMLIGRIGQTFVDFERAEDANDLFSLGSKTKYVRDSGINERDDMFKNSRWFYDTPGVVHPEQILSLLTAEELLLVLPKTLIRPQSYFLREGTSIFIGGLARLDFLECSYPVRFSVFCAKPLPITITYTKDADEVYEKFLGTDLFLVPTGSEERLSQWPGLKKHNRVITFAGRGSGFCCGDIVLSSAGWISAAIPHGLKCKMAAWTPEGRGVNVRTPSLLQHAIQLKGKRLRDTPAYRLGKVYVGDDEEQ